MSENEWRAFVTTGTRTGKAAMSRRDGSPHITPIWFVVDGTDLYFNTAVTSIKGKILRRDPRIAICVDDQEPPYSFVTIYGEAELSEELEEMRFWATKIGARYMGVDQAERFGARNAVHGEYLVKVRISKVVAEKEISA